MFALGFVFGAAAMASVFALAGATPGDSCEHDAVKVWVNWHDPRHPDHEWYLEARNGEDPPPPPAPALVDSRGIGGSP